MLAGLHVDSRHCLCLAAHRTERMKSTECLQRGVPLRNVGDYVLLVHSLRLKRLYRFTATPRTHRQSVQREIHLCPSATSRLPVRSTAAGNACAEPTWSCPELHLYSKDGLLTDYAPLKKLVEYR